MRGITSVRLTDPQQRLTTLITITNDISTMDHGCCYIQPFATKFSSSGMTVFNSSILFLLIGLTRLSYIRFFKKITMSKKYTVAMYCSNIIKWVFFCWFFHLLWGGVCLVINTWSKDHHPSAVICSEKGEYYSDKSLSKMWINFIV